MSGFQQLYYTSCEHGLSGSSGFQFNAVSERVSAETRHRVEGLAGYEPPRSLLESDAPELLARCPVNLCHTRDRRGGATTLCVRYVGRDSARRFGNYFAHALHAEGAGARDGGGPLAIELWESPVWTTSVVDTTELPELPAPLPRGPLSPRAVHAFLRAHPGAEQLPALLAAVFAALAEDGSVVVIDETTDRIAHWFAAVSYLLPPPLARGLTFATYLLRPARSRLHLIGTVPEAHPEFGPDDEESYTVFDFRAGRFPDVVPTHHLIRLLTRIGVGSVRSVWSWTAEYTHGQERALGDWHAPVAAAAAAGGIELTDADVRAVIDWLPDAGHLGPRRAAVAADIHHRHRDLDDDQLARLSAAAGAGGDAALHQELEGKLHQSRIRAYMTGVENAPGPVPITPPAERRRATALWQRLLDEATTSRQRVRLLLWAVGARLDPAPELLAAQSLDLAHALLGHGDAGAGLREEVARLVNALPEFRGALTTAVREVLEERGGQEQLFTLFPANLLTERDLGGHERLLEHYWVAQAERQPARTIELLFQILAGRGQAAPDAALLRGLWRQSSPTWTHEEATEIARRLPSDEPVTEAVGEWFDRAVKQRIRDERDLRACLVLCDTLSAPGRYAWLRPVTQECVRVTLQLDATLHEAAEATALARAFRIPQIDVWAAPLALKRHRLVPAMLRLPADPARLRTDIREFGFTLADGYLRAVQRAVESSGRPDEVLFSHVTGVVSMNDERVGLPHAQREVVRALRHHIALHWPAAELERLARALRPYDSRLADTYREYAEHRLGRVRKWGRRLTQRRSSQAPRPEEG
ncbi:GTPase-associated protein 1-related protein [Streptomyces flavofungini]|uniref:GTPase-associated protein 1-related protein n=1 Tax=Streptomyces flavofungini TaxID=68200 RepID=UPI0025AF0354|nr:GTPase-associated protein 1-related protein [Streptomyces flavofungini]WJV44704.1 GTPase-associated protein 1-related protein [Streptomyces flavofungini]